MYKNLTSAFILDNSITPRGRLGWGWGFGSGLYGGIEYGDSDDIYSIYAKYYTRHGPKILPVRYNLPTQVSTINRQNTRYIFSNWIRFYSSQFPANRDFLKKYSSVFSLQESLSWNQFLYKSKSSFFGLNKYGACLFGSYEIGFI